MTVQEILEAIEKLDEHDRQLIVEAIVKKRQQHRSILELAGVSATGRTAEAIDAGIEKMKDEGDERERQWR